MKYVVRPGDCVASLAARHGVSVESIWHAPENEALRELRESPFMLCPGDEVELPDEPVAGERVAAGGTHRFEGRAAQVTLELVLVGAPLTDDTVQGEVRTHGGGDEITSPSPVPSPEPQPLANTAYRLTVGRRVIDGQTDGEGRLSESIDARATEAQLELEPDTPRARTYEVALGYLDPPDEESGWRQRLSNLGYVPDDDPTRALEAYQKARGMPVTGALDEATKQRILDESEC